MTRSSLHHAEINRIELRNLAIGYKNRKSVKTVASGINAQILSGELTCLLGANGIGKSTLLRTLSAFQPKLNGEIFVQGNEISNYPEKRLATLVSVVLTERIDIKNISVRDLVSLGRSPYTGFWGRLTPRDNKEVEKAIALVKIENLAHRMVHTLSDGERQKTMIAKALAQDTSIIFLDEPTAFLDFPSKVEMMQLLHRLSRETEKTIFLSTHDLELALQIADKIWLMDDRAEIHVGTPEDLSLRGDLSNFFARKGIIFDRDTGLFRVDNDTDRQIRLVGHGQRYAMVRKALLRNRILAARNIASPDSIEIEGNRFCLSFGGHPPVWVESIEELLGEVKSSLSANSGCILIIGGTSEGRTVVQVCDEAAKPYFYSTKNNSQQVECAHGRRISGGLDERSMSDFCRQNNIRLIIDAAHPFAENVHLNIGLTAQSLAIPVVRFERNFPPANPKLHWFDNFDAAIRFLEEKNIENLLALTGVNTIPKLKSFWEKHGCTFRIMNRTESLAAVEKSGFPREKILFYDDERDDEALFRRLRPQAIITKESGESGGFAEKTEAALALNIPTLVIRRPALPYIAAATVFGKYGLRKQIERLLPDFFQLKTGFTTGSCATAAAKAALTALLSGVAQTEATILLPNNEPITIAIADTVFEPNGSVSCTVIKDAGDDPDVTHGMEICANIVRNTSHSEIRFLQGVGVGRITLPGLGLEIGAPAINATPREMMINETRETIEKLADDTPFGIDITVFVPRGEEIARKTFNPKLGIVGGISIIGTSGIVKPYSSEAFVASIRREVEVAKALNVERLVINSGAKSEKYLKTRYPDLLSQAFVQYGNFIGETLQAASENDFRHVTLGIMIGKAVKLAEGLLDTHSKKAVMNRDFIVSLAREANCSAETIAQIEQMTLARDLWSIVPESENTFFSLLLNRCTDTCKPLLPNGELTLLLMDDGGRMVG